MSASKFFYAAGSVAGAAKASPGVVRSLYGVNRNAAARYLQVYNLSNGTPTGSPVMEFLIKAGDSTLIGEDLLGPGGVFCSTGITYGFSTTAGSYVAATASECTVFVGLDPQIV